MARPAPRAGREMPITPELVKLAENMG